MFMNLRDWINIDKINFSLLCFNENAIELLHLFTFQTPILSKM